MNSPCEHDAFRKAGFLSSGRQRYLCRICKTTWADEPERFNRIPMEKEIRIVNLLNEAKSVRFISRSTGISHTTVIKIRKENRIPIPKRGKGSRKRFNAAIETQDVREYRQILRDSIALAMAAGSAVSSAEIFSSVRQRFPNLRKHTLAQVLAINNDGHWKTAGDLWTYQPQPIWPADYPHLEDRSNMRMEARRIWFESIGQVDLELSAAKTKWNSMCLAERSRIATLSHTHTSQVFQMFNAGGQIAKAINESKKSN